MKYHYSWEHDLVVKMQIKEEKLYLNLGHETHIIDKYQEDKNYIKVDYLNITYRFVKSAIKKVPENNDGTIWLYPISEEKVVKVNNRFYLFEKLSCLSLLKESYNHLVSATYNCYHDQKMDDPEMSVKLLHRLHWKLRMEFNIPDDEIMDFEDFEKEIKDFENG